MIKIKFEFSFDEKKLGEKIRALFKKGLSPVSIFSTIILSLILALGISMVFAWTNPPAGIPPSGNVAAPINVSSVPQTKSGNLTVPMIYDYDNTNYYVNPSGNSRIYKIIVDNDIIANTGNEWGDSFNRFPPQQNGQFYTHCPGGTFLRGLGTHDNGKVNVMYCSAL